MESSVEEKQPISKGNDYGYGINDANVHPTINGYKKEENKTKGYSPPVTSVTGEDYGMKDFLKVISLLLNNYFSYRCVIKR